MPASAHTMQLRLTCAPHPMTDTSAETPSHQRASRWRHSSPSLLGGAARGCLLLTCALLFGCGGGGGGGATPGQSSGAGGGAGTAAFSSAPVATASLVMDGSRDVSETGGDDLLAARALFRSASYPESNYGLESSAALLDGIGTTYSRTINAEYGSYVDGSGAFFAADRLRWSLEWIKRYSYNPHVIVGQRQPAFIATPASQWAPEHWAQYQDYATKFVRYVVAQYDGTGFPEALFEVGNEVDITQDVRDLWTMANPAVPQGDEGRYQHYLRVFEVWSRAVDQVAGEYPGRGVRIAGPAMGGQSLFLTGQFWHERFITDVVNGGWRLDILSHHFYGDVLNGWPNVPGSNLRAQLLRIRAALQGYGRPSLPIAITEYGPSEGSDAVFGHINYSHASAAWAAMFVQEALAGTASAGSYLIVRDNFGPNLTGSPTVASLTHIRDGVDYPKPNYNAFKMLTLLPGTRKAVTLASGQPDVRAFASSDASSAGLLAFNYNFRFNWPSDHTDVSVSQAVTPAFTKLAFDGDVLVERYLVDRTTSNLAYYLDNGAAPTLAGASLAKVESCGARVSGGNLVLPARVLGPSAVSLWLVRSGGAAGVAACL